MSEVLTTSKILKMSSSEINKNKALILKTLELKKNYLANLILARNGIIEKGVYDMSRLKTFDKKISEVEQDIFLIEAKISCLKNGR